MPLVDMPVVVGPHGDQRHVLVGDPGEVLTAEVRERGKVETGQDSGRVHVIDPFPGAPAARAHLGVFGGIEVVLLGWAAGHGVQADADGPLALELPDVAAVLGSHDVGLAVGIATRPMGVEHRRRLHNVVVDADEDHVIWLHCYLPVMNTTLVDDSVKYVSDLHRPTRI